MEVYIHTKIISFLIRLELNLINIIQIKITIFYKIKVEKLFLKATYSTSFFCFFFFKNSLLNTLIFIKFLKNIFYPLN